MLTLVYLGNSDTFLYLYDPLKLWLLFDHLVAQVNNLKLNFDKTDANIVRKMATKQALSHLKSAGCSFGDSD